MAPKKSTERSRDYRKKLKEDPLKYQQYIDREKERCKRRKETGKLKVISQLSKREQRLKRKQWRVNQNNKRANDKLRQEIQHYVASNTPPTSPDIPPRSPVQQGQNSENANHETPSRRGRKKVKANKAKVCMIEINMFKLMVETYLYTSVHFFQQHSPEVII